MACLYIYGARFLSFSNDDRTYFSTDDPQRVAFEALHNTRPAFLAEFRVLTISPFEFNARLPP